MAPLNIKDYLNTLVISVKYMWISIKYLVTFIYILRFFSNFTIIMVAVVSRYSTTEVSKRFI